LYKSGDDTIVQHKGGECDVILYSIEHTRQLPFTAVLQNIQIYRPPYLNLLLQNHTM